MVIFKRLRLDGVIPNNHSTSTCPVPLIDVQDFLSSNF